MSDTFVVAARLRLPKKGVTAWLRGPLASAADDVAFIGAWQGRPAMPLAAQRRDPKSVRHHFAARADASAAGGGGLVLAWDGAARALWLFDVHVGFAEADIAATLRAVVAASDHLTGKRVDHAVLFAETSAQLSVDAVLAGLELRAGAATFVDAVPTDDLLASLAPAQARFHAALEQGIDVAMASPDVLHPQVRQLAKHPALKKKKAAAPTLDSPEALLAAVREAKIEGFGSFERAILAFAAEAPRFADALLEPCRALLEDDAYEPGIIAFWCLNAIAIERGAPEIWLDAIVRFGRWSQNHRGWALGEVTRADRDAKQLNAAALKGSAYERKQLGPLVTLARKGKLEV